MTEMSPSAGQGLLAAWYHWYGTMAMAVAVMFGPMAFLVLCIALVEMCHPLYKVAANVLC